MRNIEQLYLENEKSFWPAGFSVRHYFLKRFTYKIIENERASPLIFHFSNSNVFIGFINDFYFFSSDNTFIIPAYFLLTGI